jgi:2-C-methyl-D-erythritol 4-phosphate cytidylyltransferase
MNLSLPAFWAVIPAAGVGARMAADRPKQYLQLGGRTILEHSLGCFLITLLKGLVVSLAVDDPYWPNLACASDRAFSALMAVPSVPVGAQCLAAFACVGCG